MSEQEKDKLLQVKGLFSIAFVVGIAVLNFILIYPLFFSSFTKFLGSFEAAYIAEARFIFNNFPHLSYNPLWHLGFPFYLFYNPLLPFLISGFHFLTHIDFSYLYRFLTGVAYIAAPLTLYLFVKYLTRKELSAVLAALAFSTATNFFGWLSPAIWADVKTYGFVPWKLIGLTVYGQGPHIFALALIPLAALFFLHTLRYPSLKYYILTGITAAAVALTHWPSFIVLMLMLFILLFSEILLGETLRKIKTAFYILLITYGFSAFWLNPAFLVRSYTLGGGEVLSNWVKLIPIAFVVVPVTVTVLFLIFDRRPRLQPFLIAILWFLIPFMFIMAFNVYGKSLVLRPDFLTPELGLATSILMAVLLTIFLVVFLRILKFRLNERVYRITNISTFVFVIGIFVYLTSVSVSSSLKLTKGNPNIRETDIYKIAQYLNSQKREGRVLAYGDSSLWLNVFSDYPQVNGFSELGDVHPNGNKAEEDIIKSKDPDAIMAWLSAVNARYLVVSRDEAQKYKTFLKEDFQSNDWIVFSVPLKNTSFVKIVDKTKFADFVFDGSDSSVKKYQKLIEAFPAPVTLSGSNNLMQINATLKNSQSLIVQNTYYKNLIAYSDGKKIKVSSSPFGSIYLNPEKEGPATITLHFGLPFSVYFGYGITIFTIIIMGCFQIKPIRKWIAAREIKAPFGVLIKPESMSKQNTDELTERTKKYYRNEENLDWVKTTDQFNGIVSYFHKNREELIKKLVEQFGKGKKYLDAGCGTGLLLRHLPEGSVGLDINPRAIVKAKEYAPKAALVVADIEEIPFPGDTFETVLAVDVLDRLPHPGKAISEIQRVLKKEGVLIGSVPAFNPLWRLQFLTTTSPQTEPYRKEYTKQEIEKLLSPFKVIHILPALSNMTWVFVAKKEL